MLQKLNERLQGIVSWVIIGIVAITFTLFGIDYYIQSRQTSSNVVVEVNGSPITKEMVNLKIERARRVLDSKAEFDEKNTRQKMIDDLVNTQVATQSAIRSGFYVGHTAVEQAIFSLPEFGENGRFSPIRYQQVLASALYTNEEFQREIQQQMLIQQQRFAFLATDFTLPNELLAYVKDIYQTRRYRYIEIPAALFSKDQRVTKEEAEAYYHTHSNEFTSPEAVKLAYIRLSMPDIKAKIVVSSDELHQYYLENRTSFSKKGKVKAFDEVKKEINKQLLLEKAQLEYARLLETLSDVSYQTSDELETTAKALGLKVLETDLFTKAGGTLPLTQNPQVIQLAFSDALLVSGENSNPLQLDPETVVVFRVVAHEPVKPLAFDVVKTKIDDILLNQKSAQAASRLGESLLRAKDDERNTLMTQYKLSWHETPLTARTASTAYPLIHQLAFKVNKVGEQLGEMITLTEQKTAYVLLQLEEVIDGKLTDISQEKEKAFLQRLSMTQGLAVYNAYCLLQKAETSLKYQN